MGREYCEARLTVRATRLHVETAAIDAMQRVKVIRLHIAYDVVRRIHRRMQINFAGAQPQLWG